MRTAVHGTHGTVVGKVNHNHHGRSYVIHLTNNGRCISRKRWHIKPTTVTTDTYIQHQSHTLSNKTTDPLAEILNNISNNPALYATEWTTTTSNTCDQYKEQNANKSVQKEADIEQYLKKADISHKKGIVNICAKSDSLQENEVNRTRSGHIVKKPDRLIYI